MLTIHERAYLHLNLNSVDTESMAFVDDQYLDYAIIKCIARKPSAVDSVSMLFQLISGIYIPNKAIYAFQISGSLALQQDIV